MHYRSHLPLLLSSALAVVPAAKGQDPAFARIIHEGIKNSRVMEFQDQLCHDIGHRLTGSLNFARACEWARGEFEKMGLDARLEQWGEWKMGWDRGQWQGRVLAPFEMELQVATPAWTGATRGQVKGRLVRLPRQLDDLEGVLAQGPVYLWGGLSRRDPRKKVLERYQKEGKILGIAMSARAAGAADNRRYPNQIRVFGSSAEALRPWKNRATLVHIVVRNDQAEKIDAALADGQSVEVQFEIRNRFRKGPVKLYNVVAELRGTESPEDYVVVCGHLDSWHQAAGATDNGTGTCSTIEAARILTAAGIKPKRSIRFILWGGEEQRLLGSRGYVKRHRSEMHRISAVFNHDNGTNWASALTVTEKMAPLLATAVEAINTLPKPDPKVEGDIFTLNARPEIFGSSGGSDHASFSPALVPSFGWRLRGDQPYGYGWHSQWDTYDLVNATNQRHNATTFALMAYQVASLAENLPRDGVRKPKPRGRGRGQAGMILSFVFGADFKGLKVTKIRDAGFAKKNGIEVGDVVTKVDGKPVKTAADVTGILRASRRSRTMQVQLNRKGKFIDVKGERERSRGRRRRR